jgi:hypothetical protein
MAIVAVVGIVVGIVVATTSGDKKAAPTTTTAAATSSTSTGGGATTVAAPSTTVAGQITYPLSFQQAEEQGITGVQWGPRCDTNSGRLAVPDFFSPPCFAPFKGNNGGATAPGVTATSIKIVYYQAQEGDPVIASITDAVKVNETNAQLAETLKGIVKFYEAYFETYGRHIELKVVQGSGNATDAAAARADATKIAETEKPFMVWGGPAFTEAFADELATRHIPCIACTPAQPDDWYKARDPYVFGLDMSLSQSQIHVLEYVRKQLVGKPASHAGDPAMRPETRRFGLVYLATGDNSKALADDFTAKMKDADAPLADVVPYELNPSTIEASAASAIAKMKADNVTTIIFRGDPVAPRQFTKAATAQNYFPEWVIGASTLVDTTAFARTYDQTQWAHAFGVSVLPARSKPELSGARVLYKWFTGGDPPAPGNVGVLRPAPALFYTVLQLVGPNLTPQTWRDALFIAPATPSAISQPSLSYGDHKIWPVTDYLGVDDATAIWWDPSVAGPDELGRNGQGMYEYVDGGRRYQPGSWPVDDKMFAKDGAVFLYNTWPKGEEPPTYPSPAGS